MKKILITCLLIGTFTIAQSVNRMVRKPFIEGRGLRGWVVDSVLIADTSTVVYCHVGLGKGWSASGDTDNYIEIPETGKRYKQTDLRGLPKAPKTVQGENKPIKYENIFPPIPPDTKVINILADDINGGSAFWVGVWLCPRTTVFTEQLSTMQGIKGNWYNRVDGGKWQLGIYEKKVFWNDVFWNFKVNKCVGNSATIELSNPKTKKLTVNVTLISDSSITLSMNGNKYEFSKKINLNSVDQSKFYNLFALNDSLTVSGYYDVAHPRILQDAALIVPDIISDKPLIYPIKINKDGTFHVKIPFVHTCQLMFSNQFGTQDALSEIPFIAEPGNHIILTYRNEDEKNVVFGGDNEHLNNEMQAFRFVNQHFIAENAFNYIISQGWDKFKNWRTEKYEKLKNGYGLWKTNHTISAKMDAFMQIYFKYAFVSDLTKGLTRTATAPKEVDFIPTAADTIFYNNPEGLFVAEYANFFTALKMCQNRASFQLTTNQIITYLKENSAPTVSEINLLQTTDSITKEFVKNKDKLEVFKRFITDNRAKLDSIYRKYNLEILNLRNIVAKEAKQKYALPTGLGNDIMVAKEFGNILSKEEVALDEKQITDLKTHCKNQNLIRLVMLRNVELSKRLELQKMAKLPKGVNVCTLPEDTKNLMATILQKYKGKVVYVDFWATWCGPCKAEFPSSEQRKAEFKGKDVVFVYVTGNSSPENVWRKMIMTLPGEHYRLSDIQWKSIGDDQKLTTIPRYILADETGKIVLDNAPRPSAGIELNSEITKLLK